MNRGRRLELGGFGAFGGAFLATFSPLAGLGYGIALIFTGCYLQWRDERREDSSPFREITVDHHGERLTGKAKEDALRDFALNCLAAEAAVRAESEAP
jgi:hypothetical protein